jgi:SNF2 family DNA or RNA helicase
VSVVRIERAGSRIFLASTTPTPGLKHSIPGAYWRESDHLWSLPLDLTTCRLLRDRFGNRLEIGPALTEWARAEKAHRAAQETLAAADDAPLTRLPQVAPKLMKAMDTRRYQRVAVAFVNKARGRDATLRTLIADTVGLGKTVEAMGAILESGIEGPYLVVCPKTATGLVWKPEIERWLPDAEVVTFPETNQTRQGVVTTARERRDAIADELLLRAREGYSLARTWVIVHPAMVRTQTWWNCALCGSQTKYKAGRIEELDCGHQKDKTTKTTHEHTFPQLFGIDWNAVVADESDQMLIRLTGTPNLQRRGMEMLRDLIPAGGLRIAMSGTPFRSKPHQLWSTLNWLDPIRFSAKWRWVQQYWKLGGYSGYTLGEFIPEREELLVDELKDIMIRRSRDQVRDDLPPKNYPTNRDPDDGYPPGIYLPMHPKQAKAYADMVKYASAEIEGGRLGALGVLAELTRCKQLAGAPGRMNGTQFIPIADGNKYEWIVEKLKELGFPDRPATKLVIASQFTELLDAFAEGISADFKRAIRIGKVTGKQSEAARRGYVNAFEDPESNLSLMFLNTKAGGSAITLDAAEIMVVLDETWVDDEQEQLEGRIDNRQPERRIVPRSYYYLRSLGTVEENIALANAAAKRDGRRLLDKDYREALKRS